jgi:plastin-1
MSFVAQLFNTCPALNVAEEVLSTFDFASLELDDAGDSREERVFRMWINSLNIPEFYVNNLFEDLHDGTGILKLEDIVQPGVVTWKKYVPLSYLLVHFSPGTHPSLSICCASIE